MKLLSGKVAHQLDAKNRIRIPAKYKNAFPEKEKLYFVEYAPGCISVMPNPYSAQGSLRSTKSTRAIPP